MKNPSGGALAVALAPGPLDDSPFPFLPTRLQAYLHVTPGKHPEIQQRIEREIDAVHRAEHGDAGGAVHRDDGGATLPAGTRAGIYCSAETGLQPKTRSHDLRDPSAALVGGRHAATWRGLQPAASRLLSMPGALNSSP